MDPSVAPVQAVPLSLLGLYMTLGLAAIAMMQVGLNSWVTSRKEKRDAERAITAAEVASKLRSQEKADEAELKAKERKEDWDRQDLVADRAQKAAEAVKLVAERQEVATAEVKKVAEQAALAAVEVKVVAEKAATAATLLLNAQTESKVRQDEVAKLVDAAAKQAASAATLLVASTEDAKLRQDEVAKHVLAAAAQAAAAADLLVSAQADFNNRTDAVAKAAAESDLHTREQLKTQGEDIKKIHTLVNSDMTEALSNVRESLKLQLIALRKVQAIEKTAPSADDLLTIQTAEASIKKLDHVLAERAEAQRLVDQQSGGMGDRRAEGATIETLKSIEKSAVATEKNTAETAANTAATDTKVDALKTAATVTAKSPPGGILKKKT